MVRQFTFNRYFHCCYRCCYMYIHVVDVNKDWIFFLSGVLRPAKHKRRWDHNLQEAHFLYCFDRCSDYILTSRKTRVEVENSGKTMTFYERSELFRKYPKTPVSDHSNYRLFERIHAVPGTSNNRGLTVLFHWYTSWMIRATESLSRRGMSFWYTSSLMMLELLNT